MPDMFQRKGWNFLDYLATEYGPVSIMRGWFGVGYRLLYTTRHQTLIICVDQDSSRLRPHRSPPHCSQGLPVLRRSRLVL